MEHRKTGKTNNTIHEIVRVCISILEINSLQWPGSGNTIIDDHVSFHKVLFHHI